MERPGIFSPDLDVWLPAATCATHPRREAALPLVCGGPVERRGGAFGLAFAGEPGPPPLQLSLALSPTVRPGVDKAASHVHRLPI